MKKLHVQSVLAYIVVGFFMGITGLMAIYPLLGIGAVELTQYSQYFAQTASVYTGIVGVVIGYYFGRKEEDERQAEATRREGGQGGPGRDGVTPAGTSPQPPPPPSPASPEPPRGPPPRS